MSFTELRNEYLSVGIGDHLYGLVRELCASISRRYPIHVYNGGLVWSEETIDDLVQEVVLNHLLREGQLDYIFDYASTIESVRRLLTRQIKRALVKRRVVTPIDRLMARVRRLATDGVLERVERSEPLYHLPGATARFAEVPGGLRTRAVLDASAAPVLYSRVDSVRESQVLSPSALIEVLEAFFGVCPCLSERQLRDLFENLLTPWVPTNLVPIESQNDLAVNGVVEMSSDIEEMLEAWTGQLSDEECCVFYFRSRDVKDGEIAAKIGKSRPTVINIKKRILESAQDLLDDVDESIHLQIIYRVQELCALRLGESP